MAASTPERRRWLAGGGDLVPSGSAASAPAKAIQANRCRRPSPASSWVAVASSANGMKLVAVVDGGQIYTFPSAPSAGTIAEIDGAFASRVQLTYAGNDTFLVTDYVGDVLAF